MTQRTPRAMRVVLKVRAQKEEAEERALCMLLASAHEASLKLEAAHAERQQMLEQQQTQVGGLRIAAEYIEQDQIYRALQIRVEAAREQVHLAERRQERQRSLYQAARCEREVISDLLKKRQEADRLALDAAEQKRAADLFLARIAQKQDILPIRSISAEERLRAKQGSGLLIRPEGKRQTEW